MLFKSYKLFVGLTFLLFHNSSYSQAEDTTYIFQYCAVNVSIIPFSKKVKIEVDFGEYASFYKNNRVRDEAGEAKKFNTIIDAFNYMGLQKWEMISGMVITGNSNIISYVFKRRIKRSEIDFKD